MCSAYTAPQSADCAEAAARNYEAGGLDVVYENTSLPLGTADFTADAQKIKDAGVEFLQTCIDTNGNLNLARALQRVDYHVAMGWPTGYEQEVLAEYGDLLQDVYFGLQHRPFEEAASSPGLQEYLTELPRLAPEAVIGNQSLIGWTNAKLFVEGLEAVGPELTRERLVETINTEFTEWDADGIIWPLDWSVQHTGPEPVRLRRDVGDGRERRVRAGARQAVELPGPRADRSRARRVHRGRRRWGNARRSRRGRARGERVRRA